MISRTTSSIHYLSWASSNGPVPRLWLLRNMTALVTVSSRLINNSPSSPPTKAEDVPAVPPVIIGKIVDVGRALDDITGTKPKLIAQQASRVIMHHRGCGDEQPLTHGKLNARQVRPLNRQNSEASATLQRAAIFTRFLGILGLTGGWCHKADHIRGCRQRLPTAYILKVVFKKGIPEVGVLVVDILNHHEMCTEHSGMIRKPHHKTYPR